jgi:hypothetical protein
VWKRIIAVVLALSVPSTVVAGPLREAAEKAGRDLAGIQQSDEMRSRARFWTGISLIAGGGLLATLGVVELDDESGSDDGEDVNNSDDGEDSDGWGNKALLGGGIAAAALGSVLLLTGRHNPGPRVSVQPGKVVVRQTVRF